MNKRGDEGSGSGIGSILTIVLLVVVVGIVAYFVVTGLGKGGSSVTNLQASQLSTAVTACQASAALSGVDFCSQLKDLGGNVFATCDTQQVRDKLTGSMPACPTASYLDTLKTECKSRITKFPATIWYGTKSAPLKAAADCDSLS